jgi:hypothetical protein
MGPIRSAGANLYQTILNTDINTAPQRGGTRRDSSAINFAA